MSTSRNEEYSTKNIENVLQPFPTAQVREGFPEKEDFA